MAEAHANIHHFVYEPTNGQVYYDEHGEPLDGFYYEIIDAEGHAIAPLFGPYANRDEVEAACKREWDRMP